ncbi:MAG: hypothetical protein MJ025_05265 [Victivallaceae bacterium]|nr:hypothetical protein [Victivallaceae bacterium]
MGVSERSFNVITIDNASSWDATYELVNAGSEDYELSVTTVGTKQVVSIQYHTVYFSKLWTDLADGTTVTAFGKTLKIGEDAFESYQAAADAEKKNIVSADMYVNSGYTAGEPIVIDGYTATLGSDAFDSFSAGIDAAKESSGAVRVTGGEYTGLADWGAVTTFVENSNVTGASRAGFSLAAGKTSSITFTGSTLTTLMLSTMSGGHGMDSFKGSAEYTLKNSTATKVGLAYRNTGAEVSGNSAQNVQNLTFTIAGSTVDEIGNSIGSSDAAGGSNVFTAATSFTLNVENSTVTTLASGDCIVMTTWGGTWKKEEGDDVSVEGEVRCVGGSRKINEDGTITYSAGAKGWIIINGTTTTDDVTIVGGTTNLKTLNVTGEYSYIKSVSAFEQINITVGTTLEVDSLNKSANITIDARNCGYTEDRYILLKSGSKIENSYTIVGLDETKDYELVVNGNVMALQKKPAYFSALWSGIEPGTEIPFGSETLVVGDRAFDSYEAAVEKGKVVILSGDSYLNSGYNATDPIEIGDYTASYGMDAFSDVASAVARVNSVGTKLFATGGTYSNLTLPVSNLDVDKITGNNATTLANGDMMFVDAKITDSTFNGNVLLVGNGAKIAGNVNADVSGTTVSGALYGVQNGSIGGDLNITVSNFLSTSGIYAVESGMTVTGSVNIIIENSELYKRGLTIKDGFDASVAGSYVTFNGDSTVSAVFGFKNAAISTGATLHLGEKGGQTWDDQYRGEFASLVNDGTLYFDYEIGQGKYMKVAESYTGEITALDSEVGNVFLSVDGGVYSAEVQEVAFINSEWIDKDLLEEVTVGDATYTIGIDAFASKEIAMASVTVDADTKFLYSTVYFSELWSGKEPGTEVWFGSKMLVIGTDAFESYAKAVAAGKTSILSGDTYLNSGYNESEPIEIGGYTATFGTDAFADAVAAVNRANGDAAGTKLIVTGGVFGGLNLPVPDISMAGSTVGASSTIVTAGEHVSHLDLDITGSSFTTLQIVQGEVGGDVNVQIDASHARASSSSVFYVIQKGSVGGAVNVSVKDSYSVSGLYVVESAASVAGNVNVVVEDSELYKRGITIKDRSKIAGSATLTFNGDSTIAAIHSFDTVTINAGATLRLGHFLDGQSLGGDYYDVKELVNDGTLYFDYDIGQGKYMKVAESYTGEITALDSEIGNVFFTVDGVLYSAEVQEYVYVDAAWEGKAVFDQVTVGDATYTIGIDAFGTKEAAMSSDLTDESTIITCLNVTNPDVVYGGVVYKDSTIGRAYGFDAASDYTGWVYIEGGSIYRAFGGGHITGPATIGDAMLDVNAGAIVGKESSSGLVVGGQLVGGSLVDAGDGKDVKTGKTVLTIGDATVSSLVIAGNAVSSGNVRSSQDNLSIISGGVFNGVVVLGNAVGGQGTNVVSGNVSAWIGGGDFNARIFGGNVAIKQEYYVESDNSTNIDIEGDIAIGFNSDNTIDIGENSVIAGSFQKGRVNGNTQVTFSGLGDNLNFTGNVSGDSQMAGADQSFVTGERTLAFVDFSGDFSAGIYYFDNCLLSNSSVAMDNGGLDLSGISSWSFNGSQLAWSNSVTNNFSGDKLTVMLDSIEDEDVMFLSAQDEGSILGWNEMENVSVTIGENEHAMTWSADSGCYLNEDKDLAITMSNNALYVGKYTA